MPPCSPGLGKLVVAAAALALSCAEQTPPRSAPDAPLPAEAAVRRGRTQVVLLGTGTPVADPDRSGPAVAVVVDGHPYLVDCGPGMVRRAEAAHRKGVEGLAIDRLDRAFLTHLHSDHTAGYADLILTPWVEGRAEPLQVYGPPGLEAMTEHLLAAYEQDRAIRLEGNQPATPEGWKVLAQEVSPGEIYRDQRVTVKAFPVHHGAWKVAYGYRFETADRTVVISGDTTAVDSVVEACAGCDLLIHEVYAREGFLKRAPDWQAYHADSHTSSVDLGELAARALPEQLVLYHQLLWGASEESLLQDIRRSFRGEVAWGNDLDVF